MDWNKISSVSKQYCFRETCIKWKCWKGPFFPTHLVLFIGIQLPLCLCRSFCWSVASSSWQADLDNFPGYFIQFTRVWIFFSLLEHSVSEELRKFLLHHCEFRKKTYTRFKSHSLMNEWICCFMNANINVGENEKAALYFAELTSTRETHTHINTQRITPAATCSQT